MLLLVFLIFKFESIGIVVGGKCLEIILSMGIGKVLFMSLDMIFFVSGSFLIELSNLKVVFILLYLL